MKTRAGIPRRNALSPRNLPKPFLSYDAGMNTAATKNSRPMKKAWEKMLYIQNTSLAPMSSTAGSL